MDCSVILVSFHTRELTLGCIASVLADLSAGGERSIEIVVVDNASEDGSVEEIRRRFPRVKLIANSRNVGFARAVNQAIEIATGRTFLLLNPDAVVTEGAIGKLLDVLSTPDVGAVGPLILSPDGTPQHHCAARELSLVGQLAWHFRLPSSRLRLGRTIGPHGARQTERLSGAALAVRKDVVETVGPLDERFFLYYEDADWVLRIRRAGYQVACVTEARVIHELGASTGTNPLARASRAIESELLYFAKHKGVAQTTALRFGVLVASALRALTVDGFRALRRSERHRLVATFRTMRSCLDFQSGSRPRP